MTSTGRGLDLEQQVFSLLEAEIKANRFIAKPECCAIFHRKAYYSRDRQSNIVFDVSIEIILPGATTPSTVWLIECKNYSHPVPVNDVEEFFAKVQQVAAAKAKAVMVTNNSFDRGTLEFARAKGIGLLRVFPLGQLKWVLHRSPSSLHTSRSDNRERDIWTGLTQQHYQSRRFDFFCNFEELFTCSLEEFFLALASEVLDAESLNAIATEPSETNVVPFITDDEIEYGCRAIHSAIQYQGGAVSLQAVCTWQEHATGLKVLTGAAARREGIERDVLGRISFEPACITVFFDPMGGRRQRFTLAHELGHWFLGHGSFLQAESVDQNDVERDDDTEIGTDDIRRLEWQANRFASCLLLPRDSFLASAIKKAREMDLQDHGHGLLYVDHQRVNQQNHFVFTSDLATAYDVSQRAVSIRLKNLGLLKDVWTDKQSHKAAF